MIKHHASLLTSLLAMLLLSACGGGSSNFPPKDTSKSGGGPEPKFVLLDPATSKSITCSGLQERYLQDGRLEIVANVRNLENRRLEVQINCVFRDDQNFPLDETPFQIVILTENATEGIRFTSVSNKAKSYSVRVRQSR